MTELCPKCGHAEHVQRNKQLAGICIGCPCDYDGSAEISRNVTPEWTVEIYADTGERILTRWYINDAGNRSGREVAVFANWNGKDDMASDERQVIEILNGRGGHHDS